jgi:hypothetical protein
MSMNLERGENAAIDSSGAFFATFFPVR